MSGDKYIMGLRKEELPFFPFFVVKITSFVKRNIKK
jgi:hypothetical protein